MSDDVEALTAAITAGARGYLLKGADETTIIRALTLFAAGEVVFGPHVGDHILDALTNRNRYTPPLPALSNRDREILDLVAQGLGNIAIAHKLSLSDKTVRNQGSAIIAKLGVRDRAEAIAQGRAAGLGDQPTTAPPPRHEPAAVGALKRVFLSDSHVHPLRTRRQSRPAFRPSYRPFDLSR